MTYLSIFFALLRQYTTEEDIVVGTVIANRSRSELEGLIGFLCNTLALRADLSGRPTFRQLLRRVREVALGAYAHRDLPLALLIRELEIAQLRQPTPLFNVLFQLMNYPMERDLRLSDLIVRPVQVAMNHAEDDLTFRIIASGDRYAATMNYKTDLLDGETIRRMADDYCILLGDMVADPDKRFDSHRRIP